MIRALLEQRKSSNLAFVSDGIGKKKKKKVKGKRKGKEPTIELALIVELAFPLSSNRPLRIYEPFERVDKGVSIARVPVVVPHFRGCGEAVLDEEFDRPPVIDPAAKELFEEVDSLPLRRRPRRRSPPPPQSPQSLETKDMVGRRSVLDFKNVKLHKSSVPTMASASGSSLSPQPKRRKLV